LREIYFSVDIEADGPVPGIYSMLSLGVVRVDDQSREFYAEMKPISENFDPETVEWLRRHGLDRDKLKETGEDPAAAIARFTAWLKDACPADSVPVFVAVGATFDWMFVAYYLVLVTGSCPFGHAGLDMKSLVMGLAKIPAWADARSSRFPPEICPDPELFPHPHHALMDAREQAEMIRLCAAHFGIPRM
jgi:hypothetical protein